MFVWYSWPSQRPLPGGGEPPPVSDTPQLAAAEISFSDKINIWRETQEDGVGFIADDAETGTTRLLHNWLAQTPGGARQMRRNALCCFLPRFEIEATAEGLMEIVGAHLADQRSWEQCQQRAVHLPVPALEQVPRA